MIDWSAMIARLRRRRTATDGSEAFRIVDGGASRLLIVADHASNRVPADIDLGIAADLHHDHIAFDPGTARLAEKLAAQLRCRAVLGNVSRLVCDYNREEDGAGLIPPVSDGIVIAGNAAADREARLERFHRPYHFEIARQVAAITRPFLVSLHSFTPQLRTRPEVQRPWEIGFLYNRDRRAAALAIDLFDAQGFVVGDQQPYSGRDLNYTMDRHAESGGIPYLGIEIRQDVIERFITGDAWPMLAGGIETCQRLLP